MTYKDIKDLKVDEGFEDLLSSLSKEEYDFLEQSLLKNGFEHKYINYI